MKLYNDDLDKRMNDCLKVDRIPFKTTKEEAWNKVYSRLHKADVIQLETRDQSRPWLRLAVAASFIIAVMFAGISFFGSKDIIGGPGITKIELPDGSEVLLKETSSIAFNEITWAFDREVELNSGQAFFKVEEGEKFTVETERGEVEVLGTSFDVDLSGGGLKVACKTGKVRVRDAQNEVDLLPGDLITIAEQKAEIARVIPESIDSWTRGDFNFENIKVSEVLDIVASQKGYDIEYLSENDLHYTGQFNMNQPVEEILEIICLPVNLKYELHPTENKITITKN